ncbi:hypothetical protein V1502_05245 [Bacillus sp. SCS-153A]|uniref:hypothetical protein n=1 Tax=Rossellomorea sedimentorum TaxID=3115294 RepID=UPI0039064D62
MLKLFGLTEQVNGLVENFIIRVSSNIKEFIRKGYFVMNSQTYMLLGWLSILASGVIYTLERLTNAIVFVGVNASDNISATQPGSTSLFGNMFFILFLILSLWFFYNSKKVK